MFVCKAPLGKGTGSLQLLSSNTGLPTIKKLLFSPLDSDGGEEDDFGCSTLRELDERQLPNCCGLYPHPFSCERGLIGHGAVACFVSN